MKVSHEKTMWLLHSPILSSPHPYHNAVTVHQCSKTGITVFDAQIVTSWDHASPFNLASESSSYNSVVDEIFLNHLLTFLRSREDYRY